MPAFTSAALPLLLLALAGGLLLGALATALLLRGRSAAAATAAATAVERARALAEERDRLAVALEAQRVQAATWRDELDAARDDRAQLSERAARVPELQQVAAALQEQLAALNGAHARLREEAGGCAAALAAEREALAAARTERRAVAEQLGAAQAELARLQAAAAELGAQLAAERDGAQAKLAVLLDARETLTQQFRLLAGEILEEKSRRFTEQNQANLGQLLEPLRTRLAEFQGKVEQVYVQEGKDRSALAEQVRQLMALNRQLSAEANSLTQALKGSSKAQGNWGELVLERVLEASGLRRGHEYEVQESHARDDGGRAQPDVVIRLPEDRHLVVDAKVSLLAYEEYVRSDDEAARAAAARRHLESVRQHIRGLSERNYEKLHGLRGLDFVLLFVPVEPAFMLAVTADETLFMDAWQRNVLLVSPSTLLFVVRTVAHLWRQEAQNRNAQEIAQRGAELYDKLAGFVADLESLGNRLRQAQADFDSARAKLATGRGNVIRQAEMLRELGVKPSKALPAALVDRAQDADPLPPAASPAG